MTFFISNCLGCSTWSTVRSEEHTSELQSHLNLVCRLLLEKKNDAYSAPFLRHAERAREEERRGDEGALRAGDGRGSSEEHTSELQSPQPPLSLLLPGNKYT